MEINSLCKPHGYAQPCRKCVLAKVEAERDEALFLAERAESGLQVLGSAIGSMPGMGGNPERYDDYANRLVELLHQM